jgi:hypothetical protein
MTVFHERATPETLKQLARRLTVPDDRVAIGQIAVSESGYLPVPHKNKYGQDYDPNADKSYIGVKQ